MAHHTISSHMEISSQFRMKINYYPIDIMEKKIQLLFISYISTKNHEIISYPNFAQAQIVFFLVLLFLSF